MGAAAVWSRHFSFCVSFAINNYINLRSQCGSGARPYLLKIITMRHVFFSAVLTLCGFVTQAQTINELDSVFFDLANAVIVGDSIDIPVSIKSNDVINALDFWLKYDHAKLDYRTAINHTGYMQVTEYYQPLDSTVRFTSNSFTAYQQAPFKLVSVRFHVLEWPITAADFNSVGTLLNGDSCSHKIVDDVVSGVNGVTLAAASTLFPNPARHFVTVKTDRKVAYRLVDVNGRETMTGTVNPFNATSGQLDISSLASGVYFVQLTSGLRTETLELIVCNR